MHDMYDMSQMSKGLVAVYVAVALILSAVIGFALVQMTMSARTVANIVVVPQTQIASTSISAMTGGFAQLVRDESFVTALQVSDFGGVENAQNIGTNAQIEISVPTEAIIQIVAIAPTANESLQFAQNTVDGVSRWIERYYPQQYTVTPMPMVAREAWGASPVWTLILGVASIVGGFVLSGLIFATTTLVGRRQSAQIMRGKIHDKINSQINPQSNPQATSPFNMQSLAQKPSIKNIPKTSGKTPTKTITKTLAETLAEALNSDTSNLANDDKIAQNEDYMRSTYTDYADYDQLIAQTMNADAVDDVTTKNEKDPKGKSDATDATDETVDKKGVNESTASKLRKIATAKVAIAMPPSNLPAIDESDSTQSNEAKQIAQNEELAKSPTAKDAKKRLNELLSGKS